VITLDEAPDRVTDMRAYVAARLLAVDEPGRSTPYRGMPELAARVAVHVATASAGSFLVAAISSRVLSMRSDAVDPDSRSLALPSEAGEALAGYLENLPNPRTARHVLRPLAWSFGAGLPWGTLWAPIATRLAIAAGAHDDAVTDADIKDVLDSAGDLIVESASPQGPSYRLFHEALAEQLRRDIAPEAAHAVIADVLDAELSISGPAAVSLYTLTHLVRHLSRVPERADRLFGLVTDPQWERAKRQRYGHAAGYFRDLDLAVESALRPSSPDLVRLGVLCSIHADLMLVGPPEVADVLARGGHYLRAWMMANNISFAIDRCRAFALLAPPLAAAGSLDGASQALAEAERTISAIDVTHQPMAWAWIATFAAVAGVGERSLRAASAARLIVETWPGDRRWEFSNGLFWAAKAAQAAGDKGGAASLGDLFDRAIASPGRNQELQAAALLGKHDVLRQVAESFLAGAAPSIVRGGNLALALAETPLTKELEAVLLTSHEGEEDDARKRRVWALSKVGRFDEAFATLARIKEREQRAKALRRIGAEALLRADAAVGERAKNAILDEAFTRRRVPRLFRALFAARSPSIRTQALLVTPLFLLDPKAGLRQAEALARTSTSPDATNTTSMPSRAKEASGRQPLKAAMLTTRDQQLSEDAMRAAEAGTPDVCLALLQDIAIPKFRWAPTFELAKRASAAEAPRAWARAFAEARFTDHASMQQTIDGASASRGIEPAIAARLRSAVTDVERRWSEAAFEEQYEMLRQDERPGSERTAAMEELFSSVQPPPSGGFLDAVFRSDATAPMATWDAAAIRALAASDSDGRRIMALALWLADPALALQEFELVAGMVEHSHTALEQYQALRLMLALAPRLAPAEKDRLRAVIADQQSAHIKPGGDRSAVVEKILAVLDGPKDRAR
jgi:hypothetical protein